MASFCAVKEPTGKPLRKSYSTSWTNSTSGARLLVLDFWFIQWMQLWRGFYRTTMPTVTLSGRRSRSVCLHQRNSSDDGLAIYTDDSIVRLVRSAWATQLLELSQPNAGGNLFERRVVLLTWSQVALRLRLWLSPWQWSRRKASVSLAFLVTQCA